MKITNSDFEILKSFVLPAFDIIPPLQDYLASGNTHRRWCFDAFWVGCRNDRDKSNAVMRNIYSYANDDHLYTALKKIAPK